MDRHDDELKKVVLTTEDMNNIEGFYKHFNADIPAPIMDLMVKFQKDPTTLTFEDQTRMRAYIAQSIITLDIPILKDKAFDVIRSKCEEVWFTSKFDEDLTDLFSSSEG